MSLVFGTHVLRVTVGKIILFTIEYSNFIRIPIRIFEYRFRYSLTSLILGHEYNSLLEAFERLKIVSFDQSIFLSKAKMM